MKFATKLINSSFFVLIIILFCTINLQATNLKFDTLYVSPVNRIYYGEELTVNMKIGNNNVLTADKYSVLFSAYDTTNKKIVFRDTVPGTGLLPFTDTSMTVKWDWKWGSVGNYKLNFYIDFDQDIDTSDNSWTEKYQIWATRDMAIDVMMDYSVFKNKFNSNLGHFSVTNEVFFRNFALETYSNRDTIQYFASAWQWFGWVNYDKESKYGSETGYFFVNPLTLGLEYYKGQWWPSFKNKEIFTAFDPDYLVAGTFDPPQSAPEGPAITDSSASEPPEMRVCAILVSGVDNESPDMETSFANDLDFMKKNLMYEGMGPRIPDSNIVVMPKSDSASILNKVRSLAGKYDKIYFYYTGHGSKYGYMLPDEKSIGLSYYSFFDALYDTRAENLCVIIDACFAGKAVEIGQRDFRFKNRNIEIIASSDTVRSSRKMHLQSGNGEVPVGAFSWFFIRCFGEKDADLDKDGKTSFVETIKWVKAQDPKLPSGRKLDTLQRPMYVENTVVPSRPPEEVKEQVQNYMNRNFNIEKDSSVTVYLESEIRHYGTKIHSWNEEYSYTLDTSKYVVWIDYDKYSAFGHKSSYMFIDPYTVEDTLIENYSDWWPSFDNDTTWDSFDTNKIIWGTNVKFDFDVDNSGLTGTVENPNPGDSVCALLVGGWDEREWVRSAFEWDLDIYKWMLTQNPKGPKLPESSIEVMQEADVWDLRFKLDDMKGKYKKIYFYFAGHGNDIGEMCFKNFGHLSYDLLFEKLYNTEAQDLCLFVDCCYSGLARDGMESNSRYTDRNIEIITSSNSNKSSYMGYFEDTGTRLGFSEYSRFFAFCSVDVAADRDGDSTITSGEAFDWVTGQNPETQLGKRIDTLQRPTRTVVRSETITPATSSVMPAGTNLELLQNEAVDKVSGFTVQLRYDNYKWDIVDNNVIFTSPRRYWNLEINPETEFDFDLKFSFDDIVDSLPEEGYRAMLRRINPDSPWEVYVPSIWDDNKKILTGKNVTGFSDWAFASVRKDPTSVDDGIMSRVNISSAYPNPFNDIITLKAEAESPGRIKIDITDNLGRTIKNITDADYEKGTYYFTFSAQNISPGIYFARLSTGSSAVSIPLVFEK